MQRIPGQVGGQWKNPVDGPSDPFSSPQSTSAFKSMDSPKEDQEFTGLAPWETPGQVADMAREADEEDNEGLASSNIDNSSNINSSHDTLSNYIPTSLSDLASTASSFSASLSKLPATLTRAVSLTGAPGGPGGPFSARGDSPAYHNSDGNNNPGTSTNSNNSSSKNETHSKTRGGVAHAHPNQSQQPSGTADRENDDNFTPDKKSARSSSQRQGQPSGQTQKKEVKEEKSKMETAAASSSLGGKEKDSGPTEKTTKTKQKSADDLLNFAEIGLEVEEEGKGEDKAEGDSLMLIDSTQLVGFRDFKWASFLKETRDLCQQALSNVNKPKPGQKTPSRIITSFPQAFSKVTLFCAASPEQQMQTLNSPLVTAAKEHDVHVELGVSSSCSIRCQAAHICPHQQTPINYQDTKQVIHLKMMFQLMLQLTKPVASICLVVGDDSLLDAVSYIREARPQLPVFLLGPSKVLSGALAAKVPKFFRLSLDNLRSSVLADQASTAATSKKDTRQAENKSTKDSTPSPRHTTASTSQQSEKAGGDDDDAYWASLIGGQGPSSIASSFQGASKTSSAKPLSSMAPNAKPFTNMAPNAKPSTNMASGAKPPTIVAMLPKDPAELEKKSIKELKTWMSAHGVSSAGIFDKSGLIEAIKQSGKL